MRMRHLFGARLRQAPADAETAGHQLLLRGGYLRPLAAGIFSLLPLGLRVQRRIEAIVREEMARIGGQEVLMPVVHPSELWQATGRWQTIGPELGRFTDRGGRAMALAMTHEEVVAALAASELGSWRQLPALIWHLQTKWRDDARPRAGLIRVREFTMLDSYSLDLDDAGLDAQYDAHFNAYERIFRRVGLPFVAVEADTGMMGGQQSHEFMYPSEIGEDTLLLCSACAYTANRQVARTSPPPASAEAPRPKRRVATPGAATIEALAAFLGVPASATAKAVFFSAEGVGADHDGAAGGSAPPTAAERDGGGPTVVLAIVRGDMAVNETKLSQAIGARRLTPATDAQIVAVGAVPGYASPIGLGRRPDLRVVVDAAAAAAPNLAAGANEAGHHFVDTCCGRDYEADLVTDIALAREGDPCPRCGAPMRTTRGVEVGNIFKLGTRYSERLGATVLGSDGQARPVVMGSYGIGIGRLLACIAEAHHDGQGLAWPIAVAPFAVHLIALRGGESAADDLYAALVAGGIDVLYDDRDERPGVKFADADLIGAPIRATVGERSLAAGGVELRARTAAGGAAAGWTADGVVVPVGAAVDALRAAAAAIAASEAALAGDDAMPV